MVDRYLQILIDELPEQDRKRFYSILNEYNQIVDAPSNVKNKKDYMKKYHEASNRLTQAVLEIKKGTFKAPTKQTITEKIKTFLKGVRKIRN